jgi:hypothetical protein
MDGFPRVVEGTVVYMRSEREGREPCICCPDGVHVFSQGIALDEYEDRWPYDRDEPSPHRWINDMIRVGFPEIEGKRVRLTMEVLD